MPNMPSTATLGFGLLLRPALRGLTPIFAYFEI